MLQECFQPHPLEPISPAKQQALFEQNKYYQASKSLLLEQQKQAHALLAHNQQQQLVEQRRQQQEALERLRMQHKEAARAYAVQVALAAQAALVARPARPPRADTDAEMQPIMYLNDATASSPQAMPAQLPNLSLGATWDE